MQLTDEYWMAKTIELAKQAEAEGEIPVAAIVVKDNQLIASGYNQSIQLHDASAHAEVLAVRKAGEVLQNYRLVDCTLYVSLEPCPMCAGLLVHSRIKRLVFAAHDLKTGACGSVFNLVENDKLNHQLELTSGILAEQASSQISDFFKRRRAEIKAHKQAQKLQAEQIQLAQNKDS
ncbi:tRNA adenosine(34) deaminase TadA [Catenovulum sp. 2E275]|uniref:tRNA adenosine(34) deaminase TadA n=1 Tax=Catenovulum sp. 2E275 TaxID=2980497 RepID=UPI0021CDF201|nr:tRNA adenosine(34) deaminase TadA [Catenovulum sp. 2E275]MCU4676140.1 tRNA adenosine(34) deaminase TadA [Catenovulum sp. 2E275]